MNQRYRDEPRFPTEDQARKAPDEELQPPDITSKVTGTSVQHKLIEKPGSGGKLVCLLCGNPWPCPGGVPGAMR